MSVNIRSCGDAEASAAVCGELNSAFGFATKFGNSSNFSTSAIEVNKKVGLGACGHLAIRVNSMDLAIADLFRKGFAIDPSTAKYKNGKIFAVYMMQEFGGFAVHLLQK